jgi:hypothetical protein
MRRSTPQEPPGARLARLERELETVTARLEAMAASRDAWVRVALHGRRPPQETAPRAVAESAEAYKRRRERDA